MARLNLTIPDSLYDRLEHHRDRVNVSRVCAIALAKELDMLDSSVSAVTDPRAQRLIQRLKGQVERWDQRGYEDGGSWLADVAAPTEIRAILEDWEIDRGERYELDDRDWPESFDVEKAICRWQQQSGDEREPGLLEQDGYVRGWYRAVKDVWKEAGPSLRWVEEDE
ncbi:MAG TPA: hypothetical protein VGS41_01755 [Chthonomonadales bacterium]|nr:hypothetical protein [Chthonomonadales bacterium]